MSRGHLLLPLPPCCIQDTFFGGVSLASSFSTTEPASSQQIPGCLSSVSFFPGLSRQPLARFPSYQFLRGCCPQQAEWEVSSEQGMMFAQIHALPSPWATHQALCNTPPPPPRIQNPVVSHGCLGLSEGCGLAFLEILYHQIPSLASASWSSLNPCMMLSKKFW